MKTKAVKKLELTKKVIKQLSIDQQAKLFGGGTPGKLPQPTGRVD